MTGQRLTVSFVLCRTWRRKSPKDQLITEIQQQLATLQQSRDGTNQGLQGDNLGSAGGADLTDELEDLRAERAALRTKTKELTTEVVKKE